MSERESASERVLCVLGIKLMFQPLWLALVALQYYRRVEACRPGKKLWPCTATYSFNAHAIHRSLSIH